MEPLENVPPPTAARPMLGLTILAVEDSLYASEALRLMCLRSGARIRRADCLKSARRHLQVYRPTAAIVDLGLPDGSGIDLVRDMVRAAPRISVVAAISGDPGAEEAAMDAGADCFLTKPLTNLGTFQTAILNRLPPDFRRGGPRTVPSEEISPDPVAYRDDMAHAADLLRSGDPMTFAYLGQFLAGVARCGDDGPMLTAAERLSAASAGGRPAEKELSAIAALISERVGTRLAI